MRRLVVRSVIGLFLLAAVVATTHCGSGGVGHPCIPEDEYRTLFSGFGATEVYVESRSFQCMTRVCLVDHFQGRVSCPYGQTEDDLSLPGDDPKRCRVPATDGREEGEEIEVAVDPWLVARPPEDAVYCSCRCDGPDPSADYCECPSGYACRELVPDLGPLGSGNLAGSYCVKDGGNPSRAATVDCRANPEHEDCPDPAFVNP